MQPSPPADDPAASYSTAAIAKRLGVSVPTVQRWVDSGALKAWKTVGGHRRIDAASADTFIRGLAPARVAAGSSSSDPRSPSVLIVDDNPDDRDLLAAIVTEAFPLARLDTAEDGFAGLVAIGQHAPDILIADIVMPHMDGMELQRRVAQLGAGGPGVLFAVSSLGPADLARRGELPAGVTFVAKPVDPDALVLLLRRQWAAHHHEPA